MQQSKRCDKNDGETGLEELQYFVYVNLCVYKVKSPLINTSCQVVHSNAVDSFAQWYTDTIAHRVRYNPIYSLVIKLSLIQMNLLHRILPIS